MNITELQTFLAIIECGSLVRASRRLNVTQSTVTARLKTLEEGLGQSLVNRQKSGVTLTPAGVRLLRYATTITDLWRQARQETSLPNGLNSVCNIACETDLWPGLGERFFATLRDRHPDVGISVWTGSQAEVAGWMARGLSDLAFTYRPAAVGGLEQIELPSDELVLVSTDPDSPMRFDPGYVFVEAGEEYGRDHAIAYADASTPRLSFGNACLGLQHLETAGGTAYLPLRLSRPGLERGFFYRIEAPVFTRRVFLTANATALKAWTWMDACLASALEEAAQTGS
ncbi:MAG: LysR family transcriptional regulator [Kiloniellales bacterium]